MSLGIFGRDLVVAHDGASYRVSCDEKSFVVYRINRTAALGITSPMAGVHGQRGCDFRGVLGPYIGRDHCACGLDLENWLEIIRTHCAGTQPGVNLPGR